MMARNRRQPTAVATAQTENGFGSVGWLLSRPEEWSKWLQRQPAATAELFADTIQVVGRLAAMTKWHRAFVLEKLGCNTKTEKELSALTVDELQRCSDYISWVESVLDDSGLELIRDTRLVLTGAARFFITASLDTQACSRAMCRGDFAGRDYLRLGELAEAWECATRQLDSPAGDRARSAYDDNPYFGDETPHISLPRLRLLARPDAMHQLGAKTVQQMLAHLDDCEACALAYEAEQAPRISTPSRIATV
jgi:hypothetical protein